VRQLVKPAELALIKGVSKATVSEAMKVRIKDAIVEVGGRRMLDRDQALELWDQNTRRNNNAKIGEAGRARDRRPSRPDPPSPATSPPPATTAAAVAAKVMSLPDDSIPGLNESMERKEHYNAELAKVKALQARQEVVPLDVVKREAFALAKAVREALINIPDRVANQLAGESDPAAVHQLLSDELISALGQLANG
jgi:hypothetical protein